MQKQACAGGYHQFHIDTNPRVAVLVQQHDSHAAAAQAAAAESQPTTAKRSAALAQQCGCAGMPGFLVFSRVGA
jgi:hypothetical protein